MTLFLRPASRVLFVTVLSAAVFAACGGDDESAGSGSATTSTTSSDTTSKESGSSEVSVKQFAFDPASLEVESGSTVTWSNSDQILHTVTAGTPESPSEEFHEEMPEAGATASHTFDDPGTYEYFCSRHNFMKGTVIVKG